METQCKLLISNFKDPKTIQLMKQSIARSSDGSSSHSAGALKLGLKNAFELKQQAIELKKQAAELKKQALALELKKQQEQALALEKQKNSGVQLRCSRTNCAWYKNHVTSGILGSNTYCMSCQNDYMQCVGCNYQRTGNFTSCQSCRKNFL
jgi:hypothetical protein